VYLCVAAATTTRSRTNPRSWIRCTAHVEVGGANERLKNFPGVPHTNVAVGRLGARGVTRLKHTKPEKRKTRKLEPQTITHPGGFLCGTTPTAVCGVVCVCVCVCVFVCVCVCGMRTVLNKEGKQGLRLG
jgi:hypothetical protein